MGGCSSLSLSLFILKMGGGGDGMLGSHPEGVCSVKAVLCDRACKGLCSSELLSCEVENRKPL